MTSFQPPPLEEQPSPEAVPFFASSRSSTWRTPPAWLDRVYRVLNPLDLDPCSNEEGEPHVRARRHYTVRDDGLAQPWEGSVYCNPPFGKGLARWVEKLNREYFYGACSEAILLVPASTDSRWFRSVWTADRLCFVWGRISFLDGEGKPQRGNTKGSVFAYWGARPEAFDWVFRAEGGTLAVSVAPVLWIAPSAPERPAQPA